MTEEIRIAVLMGGQSSERIISLRSGKSVLDALKKEDIHAIGIDVDEHIAENIKSADIDYAFIALHGRGGEDGTIQGLLDSMNIPYTGSGVLGSALGMDKWLCKLIWQSLGLSTPKAMLYHNQPEHEIVQFLSLPLVVKPANEGSSMGISIVSEQSQLGDALQKAQQYDNSILLETYVDGEEYTVGILDNQALPVIRLETTTEFYDYDAKYELDSTQYHIPCGLDTIFENRMRALALQAFQALNCRGWGRGDIMLDKNQQPFLLEVNTVPGMTSHSLVPMAAQAAGISFNELVVKILEAIHSDH
jgi:D-alanine-D-alanine ligase